MTPPLPTPTVARAPEASGPATAGAGSGEWAAQRPAAPDLVIAEGSLLCYRIFDTGDEIRLAEAERLLGADGGERLRLTRATPGLALTNPPLSAPLGDRELTLADGSRRTASVSVRLFDHGGASVRFKLPIAPGTRVADLVALTAELHELPALEDEARLALEPLLSRIKGAIVGGPAWSGFEDYTVLFVTSFGEGTTHEQVLAHAPALAKLLLGDTSPGPLSEAVVREVTRLAFSYHADDLVLIDWDTALVLEPSGSRELLDLLEFASAQLAGLRAYDDLLGRELEAIYDRVAHRGGLWSLVRSPYAALTRQVQGRWLDLTEFTERIDNGIKVTGDGYLTRVYNGAVERFRVPYWRGSVERKLDQIGKVYTLLKGELDTRRNSVLETMIVLLIVLEIFLAVFKKV